MEPAAKLETAPKVLLIEGDPQSRQDFSNVLRENGFEVATAKDGSTGFQAYKNTQPDFVVTNLVLGEMTAIDLCEKIRNYPGGKNVGIVLVSNTKRSQKYIEGVCDKYHLVEFLQKPFAPPKLLKVLQDNLNGAASHPAPKIVTNESAQETSEPASVKTTKPKYFPANLLQYGWREKATGILTLRKEKLEKTIYFEKGNLVGIESNVKSEQMGKVLVEKGVIKEQDYLKAAQLMVEESIQLGEALVKLDCLSEEVLGEMIAEHQITKVANAFAWFEATAEFAPQNPLPQLKNYGIISMEAVFAAGIKRLEKAANLRSLLTPLLDKYVDLDPNYKSCAKFLPFPKDLVQQLEKSRGGYKFEEILDSNLEVFCATLVLCDLLTLTQPTAESFRKRIDDLKQGEKAAQKNLAQEVEELKKKLEALDREKAKLAEETATQKKQAKKLADELNSAQEELQKTVRASFAREQEISNLRKTVENKQTAPAAEAIENEMVIGGVAEEAEVFEESIPNGEATLLMEKSPGDAGFLGEEEPTVLDPEPGNVFFGNLEPGESLELPLDGANMDSTIIAPLHQTANPASEVSAFDTGADIFSVLESPGTDAAISLSGLEGDISVNPDATMIFAAKAPMNTPPRDMQMGDLGGGMPSGMDSGGSGGLGATMEQLEKAAFIPEDQGQAIPHLPIDPFAPQEVRNPQPLNATPEKAAQNPSNTETFDDFFGVPNK